MYQAKINQYYDRGLYANAQYLEAKVEYKEKRLPWDDKIRQLSQAAIAEEREQSTTNHSSGRR